MANLILRRGGSTAPLRRTDNQTSGIGRIDPWNDFAAMDRMLDNFFRTPFLGMERPATSASSSVDAHFELYENESDLVAYLFAPGLDSATLDVTAASDQVTIRGERKPQLTVTDGMTSHSPWTSFATSSASFNVSYTLPVEVDPNKVTASYKDGILEIHLAKNEAVKPKQVKVQLS